MVIHMNLRTTIVWAFPLALILAIPGVVKAQNSAGISISPLTFEITANPGEKITNVVRIFNNGEGPMSVSMDVEDFSAAGERGQVALGTRENHTYSLARWVTVEPKEFVLEAKAFKVVEFTIELPANAEPGGHYGSILATTGSAGNTSGGAVVAQKIGALLLLQVPGDVKEGLTVTSLSAPAFSEYGPVTLSARFENSGSVHLKPRGFILIKNMLGREVARLDVPQSNVLPMSARVIDVEFPGKWHFGRYTATLAAIYGSTNEPISFSGSFWVLPWKVSLGVLILLLLVLYVFYKARRRLALATKILVRGER